MICRVVLDAGHGGVDPGALSVTGRKESDYTLAQALTTQSILHDAGYEVVQTRDSDTFVGIADRVKRATDARADCLISYHWNAASAPEPHGTLTICSKHSTGGRRLARALLEETAQVTRPDPEVPTRWERVLAVPDSAYRSGFVPGLIRGLRLPAVLVEVDFATHPEAEKRMDNEDGRFLVAVAQATRAALERWRRNA